MKQYGLAKIERLTKQKDFNQVFTRGKSLKNALMTIRILPNTLNYSRLGIIVSKRRVRKATDRNRLKRLIREAFRQNKNTLPKGLDILINLNKTSGIQGDQIRQSILNILASHD